MPEFRFGYEARKQVNIERQCKDEGQNRYDIPLLPKEQILAVKLGVVGTIFKTAHLIHREQYTRIIPLSD